MLYFIEAITTCYNKVLFTVNAGNIGDAIKLSRKIAPSIENHNMTICAYTARLSSEPVFNDTTRDQYKALFVNAHGALTGSVTVLNENIELSF